MLQIHRMGWEVTQIDSILFLEEPKIAPHSDAIRRELATILGLDLNKTQKE